MSNKHKTALLFAYYWPPASGPGVQRWLKFVKFLPEFGWDVIIVTPKNGSYPNTDLSLINDIPDETRVLTTFTAEPFRLFNILRGNSEKGNTSSVGMGDIKGKKNLFKSVSAYIRANLFIPDARKGWVPFATSCGKKILKNQTIDLIITTGPPHSSHLIGLKLSQKFNLPWVADFRDPWTSIYYNEFLPQTGWAESKDYNLETQVLKTAHSSITVSNGIKTEFEDRAHDIHILPNGYDEEDFEGLSNREKDDFFRLSYIGNFKANQNCTAIWQAIKELKNSDESFRNHFRLSVTGNIHEEVVQAIQKYEIEDVTEILSFVPHEEAVNRMYESDALLFPIPKTENNEQIITGKIFEYLASRTPLLSVGPTYGDAAKILSDCNRPPMLDYDDEKQIKARLHFLFNVWKESNLRPKHEGNEHEQFSRKKLTQKLANILDQVR